MPQRDAESRRRLERNAFYGAQAARLQRARSEVRVLVRLPASERVSEYNIETLMIQTPRGQSVPLRQVAEVERGRAYTVINRREARRVVEVLSATPFARASKPCQSERTAIKLCSL